MERVFERTLDLPVSPAAAFAWHERPGALQRLNPPWEPVEVLSHPGHLRDGAEVELAVRLGPLRQRLAFRHEGYRPGREFRDRQVRGPFANWLHRHQFLEGTNGGCRLVDRIEYRLPLGRLGDAVAHSMIASKLERLFNYRHRITRMDLEMQKIQPMKILISGGTGLVGDALKPFLQTQGHGVHLLSRSASGPGTITWDPDRGKLDPAELEGFDAVVHLAGESIAQRWSAEVKRRIRKSRVVGTRLLAERLAGLERPPSTLIAASGINYYGDAVKQRLTEEDEAGTSFLAEVCQSWEAAADPAREAGIRTTHLRLGAVLSPKGGALAKLLPIFKKGLGGKVGQGTQKFSWISIEDVVGIIGFALDQPELAGPVNAVAPGVVTNEELARTLGRVLGKPAGLPVPAFAIKAAFGEMGKATVLGSLEVLPARLNRAGYDFRFESLEPALTHLLGKLPS